MLAAAHDSASLGPDTEACCADDEVICRCLNVRRSTIEAAVAVCGLASIRELKSTTGAGDGCTACHARLRELLRNSASVASHAEPVGSQG